MYVKKCSVFVFGKYYKTYRAEWTFWNIRLYIHLNHTLLAMAAHIQKCQLQFSIFLYLSALGWVVPRTLLGKEIIRNLMLGKLNSFSSAPYP